jgi:hypothetical protein
MIMMAMEDSNTIVLTFSNEFVAQERWVSNLMVISSIRESRDTTKLSESNVARVFKLLIVGDWSMKELPTRQDRELQEELAWHDQVEEEGLALCARAQEEEDSSRTSETSWVGSLLEEERGRFVHEQGMEVFSEHWHQLWPQLWHPRLLTLSEERG